MENKPKFKLIKEYPNSKKIGSIFVFNSSWGIYECNGYFSGYWTETYFRKWIGVYYELL
jgi:hypothetical protein